MILAFGALLTPLVTPLSLAGPTRSILGFWNAQTLAPSGMPDAFLFQRNGTVATIRKMPSALLVLIVGTYSIRGDKLTIKFKYHYVNGQPSAVNFSPSDKSLPIKWKSKNEFAWIWEGKNLIRFTRTRDNQELSAALRQVGRK